MAQKAPFHTNFEKEKGRFFNLPLPLKRKINSNGAMWLLLLPKGVLKKKEASLLTCLLASIKNGVLFRTVHDGFFFNT